MSDPSWSGDPEALLAQAGRVRSRARSLVFDPGRAEDVEQQAWLAMLDGPPAQVRNLPAWLGNVVRNAARQLGRSETRRRRREGQAPASEGAPPTAELVEQAEMQREVVSAVVELEEPQRTAVLLRYWRELSPLEIARMQGVPAGTVRSRIHRALAELRRKLDRRFHGDRRAWSSVLLAWVRATDGAQLAAAGGAAAPLTGVLVMGWKLWAGVAAVAGALAAWWAWQEAPASSQGGGMESVAAAPSSPVEPASSARVEEGAAEVALAESSGARASVPAAMPPPPFFGTVTAPDGTPIAGAALTLYPDVDGWEEEDLLGAGTSDEVGSFRIEEYSPGPEFFVIRAEAEGHRSRAWQAIEPEGEIELTLPWLAAIEGRVSDAETGEPLAGATIVWYRDPPSITDANGYYRLPDAPTGITLWIHARSEGYAEEHAEVDLSGPEVATVDFELHRGTSLVVEVFDRETGAPVAGADVHSNKRMEPLTRTDAEGRCRVRVREGGELSLNVVAEGYFPFKWYCEVREIPRDLSPRIPLAPLATIEGLVTDESGAPVVGIEVHARREQVFAFDSLTREEREELDLPGHAGQAGLHRLSALTDDQGAFRLPVLPEPSPIRIVAYRSDDSSAESEPVVVESSQQRPFVEIALREGAEVRGRVLLNGEPQAGIGVRCRTTADGDVGFADTDRNGRYELAHVPPGDVTVYVCSNDLASFGPQPEAELAVEAGRSYEQDLSWDVELSGISGRVISASGEPLASVRIEASYRAAEGEYYGSFETSTGDDGTYAVEVRAAEAYEVTAGRNGQEESRRRAVAGSTDVDFVLPDLGVVPVQLVDADTGEPVRLPADRWGLQLSWRESGSEAFRSAIGPLDHAGAAELHLPVGLVDLSAYANEFGYAPAIVHGVRVTQGTGRDPVILELSRGIARKLALVREPGEQDGSLRGHALLLLEDSQIFLIRGPFPDDDDRCNYRFNALHLWVGDPGIMGQRLRFDDGGLARVLGLAPGRYTLRAFPDDLLFEPETFDVTGEEPDPIEIRWRLR